MTRLIPPGPKHGAVTVPPSKSHAQRLFICAALGREERRITLSRSSRDIQAVCRCLEALGAEIFEESPGQLLVRPILAPPKGLCRLPCGESGAALRFMLPVAAALGASAEFLSEGRLAQRPLQPLIEALCAHGAEIRWEGKSLFCAGQLAPGQYALPGNVSSQFISGLLLALPHLAGESRLTVSGKPVSEGYISLTESVLHRAAVSFEKDGFTWHIPGPQRPTLPRENTPEGDWSAAAAFLCLGALSPRGLKLQGLSPDSLQPDRIFLPFLQSIGAAVQQSERTVTAAAAGEIQPFIFDAGDAPDLVPAVCVMAAAARGESRIVNAGRLRGKESDRLAACAQMLRALGGEVQELPDGLILQGRGALTGGAADSQGDHRIAMAAAAAASLCRQPVTLCGSECVEKSYPGFWDDFESLEKDNL